MTEIEMYCNAPSYAAYRDTPPMPLQNCRVCWMCGCEFVDSFGNRVIGCRGKGIRSLDGREGQWCTIFMPHWNRSPEVIRMAQQNGWNMTGPDEI